MKFLYLFLFLLVLNAVLNAQPNRKKTNDREIVSRSLLKCGGQSFNLVLISEYSESEQKNVRRVNISRGDLIVKTINSPEYVFIDEAGAIKNGFKISAEYGSRYSYRKQFDFICRQNNFYLAQVKTATFDKANPETSWKKYSRLIKPNLKLKEFLIDKFTVD